MLLVGNSNDIVIQRLRRASTGAAITDAILTGTITDPNDATIASVTLTHEGSGDYRGTTTAAITAGIKYKIVAQASNYTFRRERYETATNPEV